MTGEVGEDRREGEAEATKKVPGTGAVFRIVLTTCLCLGMY